ncbi:MAG TPA: glycosyltransferase [Methylomirabilota bacterium]
MSRPRRLAILACHRSIPARAGDMPVFARVLEELGHRITLNDDRPADLASHDLVVLWGSPGFFPRLRRQLVAEKGVRPPVASLHAEPLPPPRASGLRRWSALSASEVAKILLCDWRATDIYTNAFKLRRVMREGSIDFLFPLSVEKLEYMREHGYPAWPLWYGYHPSMGRLLGRDRDLDVLFLGDTRPPRRRRLLAELRAAGVPVTIRGSWHDSSSWGEGRTELLNRTKVIVHLQRYPGKLAAMRFVMAMANGALVISEPVYKPEPFVDGRHYVTAPAAEMPAAIRYYLDHPAERERITEAAHGLVTDELRFERAMEAMLDIATGQPTASAAHGSTPTLGESQSERAVSSR